MTPRDLKEQNDFVAALGKADRGWLFTAGLYFGIGANCTKWLGVIIWWITALFTLRLAIKTGCKTNAAENDAT